MGVAMDPQGQFYHIKNDHQRGVVLQAIAQRDFGEHGFFVQIKTGAPKRSELQNAFMWGWVYREIARQLHEAGIVIPLEDGGEHPYTVDVLHEIFKEKFLTTGEIRSNRGRTLKLYASTAKLSRKAFSEYIEQIEQFCNQLWGIHIGPPNRGIWHEYYQALERATDHDQEDLT